MGEDEATEEEEEAQWEVEGTPDSGAEGEKGRVKEKVTVAMAGGVEAGHTEVEGEPEEGGKEVEKEAERESEAEGREKERREAESLEVESMEVKVAHECRVGQRWSSPTRRTTDVTERM